jgi:chaperonin GroES
MKLKPLEDRVVVERCESEDKTRGGIVLPDTAKEKSKQGKVISVGPGRMLDDGSRVELSVKEDDTILFGSYAGTEVKVEGRDMLVIKEEDILAVVED